MCLHLLSLRAKGSRAVAKLFCSISSKGQLQSMVWHLLQLFPTPFYRPRVIGSAINSDRSLELIRTNQISNFTNFQSFKIFSSFIIFTIVMLSTLQKLSFPISLSKNVLVMDAGPMDLLINDFPEECLDRDVSPRLGTKYLSACEKNQEDILKQTAYQGVIMGRMHRLFLSIPTKHLKINKFYNIHFLLDTGSPITTLTQRALCSIHQIKYNSDKKNLQQFLIDMPYQIGSQKIQIQCSNPDKESESRPYRNVNRLGMDFLEQFKQVILNKNFEDRQFILELSKKKLDNWNKLIL